MGLGDRIVVMSGGKVRQVGNPQEVYDEPVDTFVAGFLGSPPMNFIEWDDALIGFRPEHLLPKGSYATTDALVDLWFRPDRLENLGAGRLLYGSFRDLASGQKVIVNLPSTVRQTVEPGGAYELSIRRSDLKFFDKQSGRRRAALPWPSPT